MYCRVCLYNLSRTMNSRCPECGVSFNPRNLAATTVRTNSRLAWAWFHRRAFIAERTKAPRQSKRMFCRECFANLHGVVNQRCPDCSAWFDPGDSSTFRRSSSPVANVWERFRHVCIWRGVIIPLFPIWIGLAAVITQHTLLPGASPRHGGISSRLMPLDGWPAVSMGFAWLGLAFALHAHYFWGRVEPMWKFSLLGVIAGVSATAVGWGAALRWAFQNAMD